jgi:hypothetical protein
LVAAVAVAASLLVSVREEGKAGDKGEAGVADPEKKPIYAIMVKTSVNNQLIHTL